LRFSFVGDCGHEKPRKIRCPGPDYTKVDRSFLMGAGAVSIFTYLMVNHLVQAAVSDPAFIAEAERQKLDIDAVPGDGVAQLLWNAYARSPDVVSAAREALSLTGSSAN
jgi:hypothetical protein